MLTAFAFLLSASLAGAPLPVSAKVEDDAIYTADGLEDYQAELARNKAQAIQTNHDPAWPQGPAVGAAGAVVMDAESGAVLYGKNQDKQLFPASITKLMTALLTYENLDPDDTVTFSENAVFGIESGSSNIGIDVGESITVDEALYGLMVASANEVAIALGERVSGTESNFVALMNQRAIELGCKNTHFVTPNGLHDSDHYTTAYDMALIGREIFRHPDLVEYMSQMNYHFEASKNQPDDFWILNTNDFLTEEIPCDDVIGGKTGYTDQARETLVTFAERDGKKLVCVIMREEPPYQYYDTIDLLNYAFDNFKKINIAEQENRFTQTAANFLSTGPDIFGKGASSYYINDEAMLMVPNSVSFSDLTAEITPAPYKPAGQENSGEGGKEDTQETNPEGSSDEESSSSEQGSTAATAAAAEQASPEEAAPENASDPLSSSLTENGDKVIGIIHYKYHDYELGSANVLFRSAPAQTPADSETENADTGSTAAASADPAGGAGDAGVPSSVHGIKSLLFSLIHTGAHGSVYLNILLLMPLLLAVTFILCILIFIYDYHAQRSTRRRKQMRRAQRANRQNVSASGNSGDPYDGGKTPRFSREEGGVRRNARETGSAGSTAAGRRTGNTGRTPAGTRTRAGTRTVSASRTGTSAGPRTTSASRTGTSAGPRTTSASRTGTSAGPRNTSASRTGTSAGSRNTSGSRTNRTDPGRVRTGSGRTVRDTRDRSDRRSYDSRSSRNDYNRNRPSR